MSSAHVQAVDRYNKKTYVEFKFRARKEDAEMIRAAAGGRSMNAFIYEAVREKIERDAPPEIERIPYTE